MANGLNEKLVDLRYGAGSFEHPERLIKNPEADPDSWQRIDPKGNVDLSVLSPAEVQEAVNGIADIRAQYRVSNRKAAIRDALEAKRRDGIILECVKQNMVPMAVKCYDKQTVINVCLRHNVPVPKELK